LLSKAQSKNVVPPSNFSFIEQASLLFKQAFNDCWDPLFPKKSKKHPSHQKYRPRNARTKVNLGSERPFRETKNARDLDSSHEAACQDRLDEV